MELRISVVVEFVVGVVRTNCASRHFDYGKRLLATDFREMNVRRWGIMAKGLKLIVAVTVTVVRRHYQIWVEIDSQHLWVLMPK